MLVCICKGITDKNIKDEIYGGASSYSDVRRTLGLGSCCGQCASYAKDLVLESISQLKLGINSPLAYEVKC
ncbi:MAG: bacterioferritin-associated ferredoxin [Oleiphilaceae bacterium]|jgi:bacterioferritin-associated ferredoxin